MSHILKLILRVILRRSKARLEDEVSETQSGFMNGKGTREGIYNMRIISERYLDMNKEVYACFIDYEKAFDRVNQQKMIESLIAIGIPKRDVKFIRNLYWSQRAFVKMDRELTDVIKIKRGVRQGCVLSPSLFNLYTEMIFRSVEDLDGITIGGKNINNLRYADDTVLVADTPEKLQILVNQVNEKGKEYDMKINAKKTKTILFCKTTSSRKFNIAIDGTPTEQVDQLIYLGQLITEDGKSEKEISRRISRARGVFSKMRSTLTNKAISLAIINAMSGALY